MWPSDVIISGRKVLLRRFEAADITDTYIGWLNDPEVVRFSNQRFRRHDRASCEAYLASFKNTDNHFISIRDTQRDAALGTMTAYVARHHGTVDVGILMGEPATWGRGYGSDAWISLVDWLAGQPYLRKITAGSLASNLRMVRLMERSGMSLEATLKAQELLDGQPKDIVKYARFSRR